MINAVNVATQTVATGQNILFSTTRVRTGNCGCRSWLQHDAGSGLFSLNREGIYEIQFNANVSSTSTGSTIFSIKSNGENIGGTEMDFTVVNANVFDHISASTLVKVPCGGSRTITVGNNSTISALIKDANIIIKRIA